MRKGVDRVADDNLHATAKLLALHMVVARDDSLS